MNFKTTLVLLIVLLLVGIPALILMRRSQAPEDTTVDRSLFQIKATDITSIVIEDSDSNKIVLGRATSDGPWSISQPVTAPADGSAVGTIVNELVALRSTNEIPMTGTSEEKSNYGLDKPQYKLRVVAGDKNISLLVGALQPIGAGVFVEEEGTNKIEVVNAQSSQNGDGLMPVLQKKLIDLRDKKLVNLTSSSDFNTVSIAKPNAPEISLTQDSSNIASPWRITAPTSMPAEGPAVQSMLDPLASLTATDFVDDPTQAPPLRPQLTVTFTPNAPFSLSSTTKPSTQPSTTVVFGQYDDLKKQSVYVLVGTSKTLAKVPASILTSFDKKPLDLRDKKIVTIDKDMVNKIVLDSEIPPTSGPASRSSNTIWFSPSFTLTRRQQSNVLGPEVPTGFTPTTASTQGATTLASTAPATAPTTVAVTTMPVVPPSTWVIDNPPNPLGDADDERVQELLTDLDPLTVDHYVEKLPTTIPSHIFHLTVTTVGPGGTPVTDYPLTLIDPNGIDQPYGTYNGVNFVVPRLLITHLEARFAKNPPTTQP